MQPVRALVRSTEQVHAHAGPALLECTRNAYGLRRSLAVQAASRSRHRMQCVSRYG